MWSSGRALGSRLEGHGFDPRPMLDGTGVKAMPGLIFAHPILVHYRKKKNNDCQMGHTKKNNCTVNLSNLFSICNYYRKRNFSNYYEN